MTASTASGSAFENVLNIENLDSAKNERKVAA